MQQGRICYLQDLLLLMSSRPCSQAVAKNGRHRFFDGSKNIYYRHTTSPNVRQSTEEYGKLKLIYSRNICPKYPAQMVIISSCRLMNGKWCPASSQKAKKERNNIMHQMADPSLLLPASLYGNWNIQVKQGDVLTSFSSELTWCGPVCSCAM